MSITYLDEEPVTPGKGVTYLDEPAAPVTPGKGVTYLDEPAAPMTPGKGVTYLDEPTIETKNPPKPDWMNAPAGVIQGPQGGLPPGDAKMAMPDMGTGQNVVATATMAPSETEGTKAYKNELGKALLELQQQPTYYKLMTGQSLDDLDQGFLGKVAKSFLATGFMNLPAAGMSYYGRLVNDRNLARADTMTPEERSESARKVARAYEVAMAMEPDKAKGFTDHLANLLGGLAGFIIPTPGKGLTDIGARSVKQLLPETAARTLGQKVVRGAVIGAGAGAVYGAAELPTVAPTESAGEIALQKAGQFLTTEAEFAAFGAGSSAAAHILPKAFYRQYDWTPERFQKEFPDVARRVAADKANDSEIRLVQDVYSYLDNLNPAQKPGPYVRGKQGLDVQVGERREWVDMVPVLRDILSGVRQSKIAGGEIFGKASQSATAPGFTQESTPDITPGRPGTTTGTLPTKSAQGPAEIVKPTATHEQRLVAIGYTPDDVKATMALFRQRGMSTSEIEDAVKDAEYADQQARIHRDAERQKTGQTAQAARADEGIKQREIAARSVVEPQEGMPSTTMLADATRYPTVEVPVKDLKLSKDVPQFKEDADATGVVKGEALQGKPERLGTAPVVVWQRNNGDLEVITGRHRLDLWKRNNEATIPAQVVKETDGFTPKMALTFDAESNIRDGNGKVGDYAHYFRNAGWLSEAEARQRGLLSRVKGLTGWILGKNASDDVYSLYRSGRFSTAGRQIEGKLSEDKAIAIAGSAPGNPEIQRVGILYALSEQKPAADEIRNFLQAFQTQPAANRAKQLDLFGINDAAIRESIDMGKAAQKIQRELLDELSVLKAGRKAANFAAIAKRYGIQVGDAEGLAGHTARLQGELEQWQHWAMDPAKFRLVRQKAGLPVANPTAPVEIVLPQSPAELRVERDRLVEQIAAEPNPEQKAILSQELAGINGRLDAARLPPAAETQVTETPVPYNIEQELFGRGSYSGKSALRQKLEWLAESKTGQARADKRILIQRDVQNKAKALLDALDAKRIDEAEAGRRLQISEDQAIKALEKVEREGQRRAAAAGGEQQDFLVDKSTIKDMLFSSQLEFNYDYPQRPGEDKTANAEQALRAIEEIQGRDNLRMRAQQLYPGQTGSSGVNPTRALREELLRSQQNDSPGYEPASILRRGDKVILNIIGRGLAYNLSKTAHTLLVGQRLDTAAGIQELVKTARNARLETWRILIIKDGTVVFDLPYASRLPGCVIIPKIPSEMTDVVRRLIAEFNADAIDFHNHPSGNTRMSSEDLLVHTRLHQEIGPHYKGSMTGNHGEYTFKTPLVGYPTTVESKGIQTQPDLLTIPDISHPALGQPIDAMKDVWKIAQKYNHGGDENKIILIGCTTAKNGSGKVQGVAELDQVMLDAPARAQALIRLFARNTGAIDVFVAGISREAFAKYQPLLEEAVRRGVVRDVTLNDGTSLVNDLHIQRTDPLKGATFGMPARSMRLAEPGPGYGDEKKPIFTPGEGTGTPDQPVKIPAADNPQHSILPMELPDLLELAKQMTTGPVEVRQTLGNALGRFAYIGNQSRIRIRADMARLVTPEEIAGMQAEAETWAQANSEPGDDITKLTADRLAYLHGQSREAAIMRNPPQAVSVLAHEIGHAWDWHDTFTLTRGNVLGHIAAFEKYLMKQLSEVPAAQENLLTKEDRVKLRRQAEMETGKRPPRDEEADLAAWRTEVSAKYKELVRNELDARGIVTVDQLKDELKPMIRWWRTGNPEGAVPEKLDEAAELFAEGMSVMLNNPEALSKRAPLFAKMVYDWLVNRPKVRELYDAMQDALIGKQTQEDLYWRVRKGMQAGDEHVSEMEKQQATLTPQEWRDRIRYTIDRKFGPIQVRMRRAGPAGEDALAALSDYLYRASVNELIYLRIENEVVRPLMAGGGEWIDLGMYQFARRIMQERTDIFNPWGVAPKHAKEMLERMPARLGPERIKAVEAAAAAYRTIYEQELLTKAREFEVFDDELMKKLDDNIYYAAFNVVRGKPGVDSLQTALENRHGAGAVAKIYKQFGTMRDIQNPATATMTKVAALNNMIWREFAKRKVMEAVMADPDLRKEWRPAEKVWTGKRLEIKVVEDGRVGTLIFMHKGEMVGFYGPRTMVDAFDSANPIENNILARGMGETSGIIKGLFTRWNPAFWPVAWWRDVRGFNRRMPGTAKELRNWIPFAGGVYFRYFLPAFRAAWSAYRGRPDAIAQEMLRTGQWISQAEGYMGDYGDMQPFERQLRRYGITSMEAHKHMTILDRLALAWVKYNEVGQVFERTSKTVGHLFNEARRQTTPAGQRRIEVRRWAGSPDFLEHSAGNWAIESLAMFYNPFKEGMRSEFRAWKERPGETFANTLRWTIFPMLGWSILYGGVRAALQGRKRDDLEDMAASIPDADRRCYKCIPLKWVDYKERKIMYLRIPLEEQERLIWASSDIAIMAAAEGKMDGLAGLTDYAGRQLPSANPLIKLGADWLTYAMGGNPYDNFRGRNVLDQNEAELRGMMGLRAMGRATLNQTAGSIFGRIQQNRPEETPTTGTEKFLRLPMVSTVLGRWIKVNNRGYYEKIERSTKPIAEQEAQTRVDVDNMIIRMRKGKDMTTEEATRLAQGEYLHRQFGDKPLPPEISTKRYFYTNFETEMKKVATSQTGPEIRAIMRQPTGAQKIQAIMEIQRLNRPPGAP